MCRIANKNRVRFSKRLQTSGKIHGIAKNCNACVCTILHLPNYRRPGVEPDAQLWAHAMFCFEVRTGCLELLKDVQGRTTGPKWRILQCNRRTKHRHNPIAGEGLNDTALLAHGFVHKLRQTSHERVSGFLSRTLREAREAHHVREEDCD